MSDEIEIGDHVLIGEHGVIHWEVVDIGEKFIWLRSGMSGRKYVSHVRENLTIFKKKAQVAPSPQ